MRGRKTRSVLLLLLLAGGCAENTGPVIGDWRGREQALESYRDRVTELILDGTPNATTGTYHMVSMVPSTEIVDDLRNINWSDRWTRIVLRTPGGSPYTVYHLHNPPPDHLADYILLSTGALLPAVDPRHPDTSPAALQIAMVPRPRTAYGYGRP